MAWNPVDWHALGDAAVRHSVTIGALVIVGFVVRWLAYRTIDRLVRRVEQGLLPDRIAHLSVVDPARRTQRARAVGSLLKSIISGLVVAVVATMILGEFVDIGPIVASAGILGVALGFGAQSLVKDFLSGIFMILEDQYGVGDVVDVGEATGTVEAVGLRVTRLRDVSGTVWYVRNGEVIRVGNQSQNWARSVLDVAVTHSADLTRVRTVLQEVAHDLWEDDDYRGVVIEEPEVWGVESITPDGVTMRVTLKTAPLEQWRVAREMRARIKNRFDHEGIAMPQRQPHVGPNDPGSVGQ